MDITFRHVSRHPLNHSLFLKKKKRYYLFKCLDSWSYSQSCGCLAPAVINAFLNVVYLCAAVSGEGMHSSACFSYQDSAAIWLLLKQWFAYKARFFRNLKLLATSLEGAITHIHLCNGYIFRGTYLSTLWRNTTSDSISNIESISDDITIIINAGIAWDCRNVL